MGPGSSGKTIEDEYSATMTYAAVNFRRLRKVESNPAESRVVDGSSETDDEYQLTDEG